MGEEYYRAGRKYMGEGDSRDDKQGCTLLSTLYKDLKNIYQLEPGSIDLFAK